MAGTIGRIARALAQGAMARQKGRAMHSVGIGGWKGDLIRVVGRMAGDAWNRRNGAPPAGPVQGPGPNIPPRRPR
jgi:hypothetical protein